MLNPMTSPFWFGKSHEITMVAWLLPLSINYSIQIPYIPLESSSKTNFLLVGSTIPMVQPHEITILIGKKHPLTHMKSPFLVGEFPSNPHFGLVNFHENHNLSVD